MIQKLSVSSFQVKSFTVQIADEYFPEIVRAINLIFFSFGQIIFPLKIVKKNWEVCYATNYGRLKATNIQEGWKIYNVPLILERPFTHFHNHNKKLGYATSGDA